MLCIERRAICREAVLFRPQLTSSLSSSLFHLSLAFLFSADEYVRCKEVGVDPGIELSSINGRDSGNESEKSWLTIIKYVRARQTGIDDPLWWILWKFLHFVRKVLVARAGIHVVAK